MLANDGEMLSLRRLHLRITCTSKSHVKEKLDAWPRLPIVVSGYCDSMTFLDNFKAALEHSDRICQIELMVNVRQIPVKDIFAALEKPFPALTDLDLSVAIFLYDKRSRSVQVLDGLQPFTIPLVGWHCDSTISSGCRITLEQRTRLSLRSIPG